MTTTSELLIDGYGRVRGIVHNVLTGLPTSALSFRPDSAANTISWLIWHLTRVQDAQIADAVSAEQRWTAEGWVERFALPFDGDATGYGQSPEQVSDVQVDARLLADYHDATHDATIRYLEGLHDPDLDRIVDTRWDPPVTLAVRLVSILGDDLQHAGQAAYVKGLVLRH